jgi:zona occludens toxin (predicted ATPase)
VEPTVSELVLKEYERSFNPNSFAAEVIAFFDFLQRNKLIEASTAEPYSWVRNRDLVLIENTNIIFRQVCEVSDKYTLVEQQLENAYIHLDFIEQSPHPEHFTQKKHKAEAEAVD